MFDGPMPQESDLRPMQGITSVQSSTGEELGDVASETLASSPLWGSLHNEDELASARGDLGPTALGIIGQDTSGEAWKVFSGQAAQAAAAPDVPIDDARAQVKASGLPITLPDQPTIKQASVDYMINRARQERERQATIARGAPGFVHGALDVGTSMFVGALDPLNDAAFAIPVLGEARYGKMIADAGSSILPRLALAGAIGTEKGIVGTTALTPLDIWQHSEEGQDFTAADMLHGLVQNAKWGGVLGILGGGAVEGFRALRGPEALATDLPPRAREDVLRGSVGMQVNDKPVMAGAHLDAAAGIDPRIAESVGGPTTPDGIFRTGRPEVDAILADPKVAGAILNPTIDRAHDVPYEAGASATPGDMTTHVDQRLPSEATVAGKTFDPAIPANIHEQVERSAMERMIDAFKAERERTPNTDEMNSIYETAHHEYAEPAEDAWYRGKGIDVGEVNKWWAAQDKITEHENPANPPPDLYRKPYPHNKVEGAGHEEPNAAAEWPTTTPAEGKRPIGTPRATPDQAFREMADTPAARDEPEAVAATREAAEQPEPPSVGDQSLSALEAAENEAREAYRTAADNGYLSDDERTRTDALLQDIDRENDAKAQSIRLGAACLAAAGFEAAA